MRKKEIPVKFVKDGNRKFVTQKKKKKKNKKVYNIFTDTIVVVRRGERPFFQVSNASLVVPGSNIPFSEIVYFSFMKRRNSRQVAKERKKIFPEKEKEMQKRATVASF